MASAALALIATASLAGCALIPGFGFFGGQNKEMPKVKIPSKAEPEGPKSSWLRDDYTTGQVTPWDVPGGLCGFTDDGALTLTEQQDIENGTTFVAAIHTGTAKAAWSRKNSSCSETSTNSNRTLVRDSKGAGATLVLLDSVSGKEISRTPAPDVIGLLNLFYIDEQGFQVMASRGQTASVISAGADGAIKWESEITQGIWDAYDTGKFTMEHPGTCIFVAQHTVCQNSTGLQIMAFDGETGKVTLPYKESRASNPVATREGWLRMEAGLIDVDEPDISPLYSYSGEEVGSVPYASKAAASMDGPMPGRAAGVTYTAMDLATGAVLIAADGTIVAKSLDGRRIVVGDQEFDRNKEPVGVTANGKMLVFWEFPEMDVRILGADGAQLGTYETTEGLDLQVIDGTLVEFRAGGKRVAVLPKAG